MSASFRVRDDRRVLGTDDGGDGQVAGECVHSLLHHLGAPPKRCFQLPDDDGVLKLELHDSHPVE